MPHRTFTNPALYLCLLAGFFAVGVQGAAAQAGTSPAFSTKTPQAGVVGSSLVILLPVMNSGTAAAHLRITAVSFGGVAASTPMLPFPLGSAGAGITNQLVLQFPASKFTLGKNYLLTVRGTYEFRATTLGFTVNRILTIVPPAGALEVELQHWVAIDAVNAELASLPSTDLVADAAIMLNFLRGRPEFIQSGMHSDSSSLWARFADGRPLVIANDRRAADVSAVSAARQSLSASGRGPAVFGSSLPLAVSSSAQAHPQALAAGADPSELPRSSAVRILNTLTGEQHEDASLTTNLLSWLGAQKYAQVAGSEPTVDNLKTAGGEAVFYFTTHAGVWGEGTEEDPNVYAVRTSTYADFATDLALAGTEDTIRGKENVIAMSARGEFDSVGGWVVHVAYGITANFIRKYFKDYGSGSFVYIDACHSDEPDPTIQDFKKAFFEKKASVYAGWTSTVGDGVAADSTRLLFDRLLGANSFCPEDWTDPNNVGECSDGSAEPPAFAQRAFDWQSVANSDIRLHGLGADTNPTSVLNFTSNPAGPVFGLLAPSISNMQVDETQGQGGQLTINGIFGTDPRPSGGQAVVKVGDNEANIQKWDTNAIVVDLNLSGSGSAGDVQVTVRGHKSNVARLAEWSSDKYKYTINGDGSLQIDATFNLHFRADIRKYRPVIHNKPIEPTGVTIGAADSSGSFTASGSATDIQITYAWSGGASIKGFTPNIPVTGVNFVATTVQVIDSKNLQVFVGASPEAKAPEATCTETAVLSSPQTSPLQLVGPGNLVVLIGDKGPRTFPFTLDDDAVIKSSSFSAQGRGLFSAYVDCMDESRTATYNFKWGPITPTSGTAPDPDSAR